MKILFATDLHASQAVFSKCLSMLRKGEADLLLLGGDLAGKAIMPVIDRQGQWQFSTDAGPRTSSDRSDLDLYIRECNDRGLYPVICSQSDADNLRSSDDAREVLLKEVRCQRLADWIEQARALGVLARIFWNLGNDDPFYLDEVVQRGTGKSILEHEVIELSSGCKVISCGYTNLTPWSCPRDVPEVELYSMLERKFSLAMDARFVIANLHCPPHGTSLDRAPLLDRQLRPVMGVAGVETAHVGSTAVRSAIECFAPTLSLHGHVHESYGKQMVYRTLCVNPGSDYASGRLQAALVHLSDEGVVGVQMVKEW